MAQRKQLTWTELRVGLFVLAGIVLVVVGVLFVTGTGALGPKYRVMTFLPEVDGLAIGAPVSINGVEVGNVDSITIAPSRGNQPPVPDRSVEVVMRINRNFRDYIRTDSYATLLTEGFLGNRVVSIQRGYTGQVLGDGQELPGKDIGTLLVTRDGALWIGTYNGLASWKEGKFTTYSELNGSRISALLEDGEGTVWVGTREPRIFGENVGAIDADAEGNFWVR